MGASHVAERMGARADNVEREAREVDSLLGRVGSGVLSPAGLQRRRSVRWRPGAAVGTAARVRSLEASDATNKFADTPVVAGIDDAKIKELGASAQRRGGPHGL